MLNLLNQFFFVLFLELKSKMRFQSEQIRRQQWLISLTYFQRQGQKTQHNFFVDDSMRNKRIIYLSFFPTLSLFFFFSSILQFYSIIKKIAKTKREIIKSDNKCGEMRERLLLQIEKDSLPFLTSQLSKKSDFLSFFIIIIHFIRYSIYFFFEFHNFFNILFDQVFFFESRNRIE